MSKPTPWVIAPVVAMAAFMEVLDISIANVSLQHIAGNLSASQDESTWILTSYLVTNAIVLPVSGWIASVIGRKRFYLGCILCFGVSSLACGLAPNLPMLILFRAIQGLTGGGLQPTSQAILADTFSPSQRAMAFAFYGIAVVFAPAIGPTLGGFITDNFTWRWVFLVNVPVSIALFFLIRAMIEDPPYFTTQRLARAQRALRIDYIGFGLLALGLGGLQLVLDRGQEADWFASTVILITAVGAGLALLTLVFWELRRPDPIVDLKLLAEPTFAIANLLMIMLGFILLGSTALLPLFVQSLLGYTAMDAGMVISPGGFSIMLLMPIVGKLTSKIDPRFLIAAGLAIAAWSLYAMSRLDLEADFWTIAWARIILSVGLAFLFIPISTIAYAGLSPNKYSDAASLINLSRNIGGSIGIALLTTFLSRRAQIHQNFLVAHATPYDQAYRTLLHGLKTQMMAGGASAGEALTKAQALIGNLVTQQATLLAYLDDFFLLSVTFAALIPMVFLMKRPKSAGAGPGAHE
ncbi:MAG TPA: DHA2 family efflux MFS transporter permease subunit [Stellaceae bacterium]|nr:DHA2 family efflux MFS transporter permease subunit [Stellaceae bacterium]